MANTALPSSQFLRKSCVMICAAQKTIRQLVPEPQVHCHKSDDSLTLASPRSKLADICEFDPYLFLQGLNDISSLVAPSLVLFESQHLCLLGLQLLLQV